MRRAAGAVIAVALATGVVAAAPLPPEMFPVDVVIDTCVNVPHDALRRLLAIELGPLAGARPPRHEVLALIVTVICAPEGLVVRVEDPTAGEVVMHAFNMRGVPETAQPRAAALALVEILSAKRADLMTRSIAFEASRPGEAPRVPSSASPAPAVTAPELAPMVPASLEMPAARVPLPAVVAPAISERATPDWRLLGHLDVRRFLAGGGVFLWGGGAGFEAELGRRLGAAIDLSAEQGTSTSNLGEVDLLAASISTTPTFGIRGDRGSAWVGLGARAGMLRMQGRPTRPDQVNGLSSMGAWGGPVFIARALASTGPGLAVGVGVEAGVPVVRVRGLVAGGDAVVADGPWVSAWLGMGFSLPR